MTVQAEPIETPRLKLLPLRPEHAGEMSTVLADTELYAFTSGSPPGPGELRARYERWSAGSPDPAVSWLNWVIWVRDQRCLAGTVQSTLSPLAAGHLACHSALAEEAGGRAVDREPAGEPHSPAAGCRVAEIAWIVGRAWQGKGIASEAGRALVAWLRTQPVCLIAAHIHPEHVASAAVATAAGLVSTEHWHEGERRWELVVCS